MVEVRQGFKEFAIRVVPDPKVPINCAMIKLWRNSKPVHLPMNSSCLTSFSIVSIGDVSPNLPIVSVPPDHKKLIRVDDDSTSPICTVPKRKLSSACKNWQNFLQSRIFYVLFTISPLANGRNDGSWVPPPITIMSSFITRAAWSLLSRLQEDNNKSDKISLNGQNLVQCVKMCQRVLECVKPHVCKVGPGRFAPMPGDARLKLPVSTADD